MSTVHEAIELSDRYLVQTYGRPDFALVRGEGAYLYDSTGKQYLDMVSGIAVNTFGYGDKALQTAIQEAATGLIHTSNLYHSLPGAKLAEALVQNSFADRVFFSNSGTEAVEGALKFARKAATQHHHGKQGFVSFTFGFHGRTMGALSTTANPKYRKPFGALTGPVAFAEFNNLENAEAVIDDNTAAVIVEPIQGEGGMMPATDAFLKKLRNLCDDHGATLIFDEVQCGVGRTGTLWAYEPSGVTPDIMVVAKPLGGGFPIGAILVTEAIAGMIGIGDHGSTFAGGPFITQIALHQLERVNQPDFLAHVREIGDYLESKLTELADAEAIVETIRGRGLMRGIQIAETLPVADLLPIAHDHGLLLVGAGRNTIRLLPPLIIEKRHVDELIETLTAVLAEAQAV